jgi:magnesium-transporting ATPase (P-type)
MKVDQFYSQSILIRNNRKNTLFNCELFDHVIDLIEESILYNNDCRIEMNDEAFWEPIGNGTEVGLIKFLQDAEVPVHDIMQKSFGRVETEFPFSTHRKRQVTVVHHPEKESIVRVYMKGAPEVVVSRCTRTFHTDGKVIPMEDAQTNYILNDILIQKFTTAGYRAMALAYKDIPYEDYKSMKEQYNNFVAEDDRIYVEKDLTFLGLFALHDPIREQVKQSVMFAHRGQINVRMVSGDHIETAKAVAVQAGIMDDPNNFVCLTGEEFRQQVGSLKKTIDETGKVRHYLERRDVFRSLVNGKDGKPLKVIARASSYDKYLLVVGLRDLGRTVACIGEGLNDVDALSNADVGFAMGSGVSIAKDNSDMILINDNFESVMKAVMWGRNVYQNVRRFIQFQVTVNLSTVLLVIMGSATKGSSPISINQLLWINLIMDTFAAIALGSERPHPSIITSPPVKHGEALITPSMWKQIYCMTIYIFTLSTIFYFFVDDMWGIEYDNATEIYENGDPTPKGVVFTMIFNAFVWMHIFNEFNCRKVAANQFNMFHGLISNWMFLFVIIGIMLLQIFLVQEGGEAM